MTAEPSAAPTHSEGDQGAGVDLARAAPLPLTLVAIGSSAGGLEALRELIGSLPRIDSMSYVIAQHLSPTHSSLLMELLTPGTDLAVRELKDEQVPEPNTIYVTPPNFDVTFDNRRFHLERVSNVPGPKPSVDRLFESLAAHHGEDTVGIILSGTGSDGATGVRAIKAAGGSVLVQTPDHAKYDGMPKSAINTGCADLIQKPAEMGATLQHIAEAPRDDRIPLPKEAFGTSHERVIALTKRTTGTDLGHYKTATVERRIRRRMAMMRAGDMDQYVAILQRDPGEARALSRDILISVTEFFRDREHFDRLERRLRKLIGERNGDDVLRIWVPGCATGEEAYSLSILLSEIGREIGDAPDFLIFASDIDSDALATARAGAYSESALAQIGPDLKARYFRREGAGWVIDKTVRQTVVFAAQNVIEDPPFSRIDLISCRNVLIYFTREVQKRVLAMFHFSLKPGGLLFLGNSESIESQTNLFEALDARAKLFRRTEAKAVYGPALSARGSRRTPADEVEASLLMNRPRPSRSMRLMRGVMDRFCPPLAIVDGDNHLVFSAGAVKAFLSVPTGETDTQVFEMLDERVRAEARALIHRVRREKIQVAGTRVSLPGALGPVRLVVHPLSIEGTSLVMLVFEPVNEPVAPPAAGETTAHESLIISELESELASTRTHLQTVVEELETANEELQSQSEELQSANEELQSTNEELQTSNEELQSTNEELSTVNDELQGKAEEIARASATLMGMKESIRQPMLIVDERLEIKLVNNAASRILEAAEVQPGRAMSSLTWRMDYVPVMTLTLEVIRSGKPASRVIDVGDDHYLLEISPTSLATRVDGAVMIFTDITELVSAQRQAKAAASELATQKERYEITLHAIGDGVISTDARGMVTYANPKALALIGRKAAAVIDRPIDEVYSVSYADRHRLSIVDRVLASRDPVENTPAEHPVLVGASGRWVIVDESAAPLIDEEGRLIGVVVIFRDVTDVTLLSQELSFRAAHDPLTQLVNRGEFERRLGAALQSAREHGIEHALVLIDLDNFKVVNDTCGHAAGDRLLQDLSQRLKGVLRTTDVLARLGGDEFAALLVGCDHSRAAEIADKLRDAASRLDFSVDGVAFAVTASIGVVSFRGMPDEAVGTLLARADAACYAAKGAGRDRVYVAQRDDPQLEQERTELRIVSDLGLAIQQNRLALDYEDCFSAAGTGPAVYRELLVRYTDNVGNRHLPAFFLAAAERFSLIAKLDAWVIETVCEHLAAHAGDAGLPPVWAVNVSGRSLGDSQYRTRVLAALRALPPGPRICFEITETSAIANLADVSSFMDTLRALGCQFALDDFGTVNSGFDYVRKLHFDYIKIGSMFVQGALHDHTDLTMVESILAVARKLSIKTIAEHVSSAEALAKMRELGVDLVQGWYLGPSRALDLRDRSRSGSTSDSEAVTG